MTVSVGAVRAGKRVTAVVAVPLLLLGLQGPFGARTASAPARPPLLAEASYRLGYASGDEPRISARAGDGTAADSPVGPWRAEQPSTVGGAVAYVKHRTGHVDTDLAYQPPRSVETVALTSDDATDRHPALSPDGTRVAFESDRSGQPDLWVINVDGTGLRRLTDHPADDTWPTWSPTGDRLAFSSNRDDPAGEIYTVAATGGAVTRLTADPAADTQPAWSPAGNRIAFTTTRAHPGGDLATVAPTGGAVTLLTGGEQPAWSADAARLAYVTRAADPGGDIAVLAVATGSVRPVADGTTAQTDPAWYGGVVLYTEIVGGFGERDIWSAGPGGGDRRNLTNRPGVEQRADEGEPAYSADGTRLAYAETNGAYATRIVVADADGRDPRPLNGFVTGLEDHDPAWSPDGRLIAFSRDASGVIGLAAGGKKVVVARVDDGTIVGSVPMPEYLSGDDYQPAWSPDGTRLAIVRDAAVSPVSPARPGRVDRWAYAGGGFSVEEVIATPVLPPRPDIVFLVDTTGSMDDTISSIRTNIHSIVAQVLEREGEARFALVGYRSRTDVGDGDDPYDAGYKLAMPLREIDPAQDGNPLDVALGALTTGGGNLQEDWLHPLHRIATGGIAFRPDSSRIVVLIGDAPSAVDRSSINDPDYRPPRIAAVGPPINAELAAAKIRVVAVPIIDAGEGGLDRDGQAALVTKATGGVKLPPTAGGDPQAVTQAIIGGLQQLSVTVTPTVTGCAHGLTVTFTPPGPTTVTGGTDVTYRQTVALAADAHPGDVLGCTVRYQLAPSGGTYSVPFAVRVADPTVPLVTVDDVTVRADGPAGTAVSYTATATDRDGTPLTPSCAPPSDATFPIGQTRVVCTAVGATGAVGRDTALISVIDSDAGSGPRIWLVTIDPVTTALTVGAQTDFSTHVGEDCPAAPSDGGPAPRLSDDGPAWSPDGGWLAFTRYGRLCVADTASGTARMPIPDSEDRPGVAADPAWSPDGTTIAYGWSRAPDNELRFDSIRTVPAAGGPTELAIGEPVAGEPAYQPLAATALTVTVTAAPQPGYVGGAPITVTVTARNAARIPAARVWLGVTVPAELLPAPPPVSVGTLAPGAEATMTVTLPPVRAVVGAAVATVSGLYSGERAETARAQAPVIVILPRLTVDPEVGPPGFVPLATGTGFPPGATVTLAWHPGLTARTEVLVGPDGTFRQQVLVFHHDVLGARQLTATGTGFGPVGDAFTVVPATLDPKDFVQRR